MMLMTEAVEPQEQESFLHGQAEDSVEDDFHRRLHLADDQFYERLRETSIDSSNISSSSMITSNVNNSFNSNVNSSFDISVGNNVSQPPSPRSGSFWRAESCGSMMNVNSSTGSTNSHYLGAVLHLHSATTAIPAAGTAQALAAAGCSIASSTNHNGGDIDAMCCRPLPVVTNKWMFLKSSSLIYPSMGGEAQAVYLKRRKINQLLDQCEMRWCFCRRSLHLEDMQLTVCDIPVKDLDGTSLGATLSQLSLAGNRLSSIPPRLVQCLSVLKQLDLSQCHLHQLPEKWDLPQLKRLNLSHNRLTEFPHETMLMGLPELQELNLYGNKLVEIVIPSNPKVLSKLQILNVGYNDLTDLPDELDQLKALRVLKLMNNFLEKVPMRVCDMELRQIDVSSNPVIQPPIETCERGICSMKRYYHCLRMEEQSKQKQLTRDRKRLGGKRGSRVSGVA